MYKVAYVSDRRQLQKLCHVLGKNVDLGRYTRAIYIYSDDRQGSKDLKAMGMDDYLVSLIRYCRNLQNFIVIPELNSASFLNVADALRTYCCHTLRLLQWKLVFDVQSKAIQAMRSMRSLVALQIELSYPPAESQGSYNGIRQLVDISFPQLRQLCLKGAIQEFVEQIVNWELPALSHLTLDFKLCRHDFPDLAEILTVHGPQLELLDINSILEQDVAAILNICRRLTTFCFNLDWQLNGNLVGRPHDTIRTIGLYGLRYAFGVGIAQEVAHVNPLEALVIRRRNDMNFLALNKVNFPALQTVRVLEQKLLVDLNENDGPDQGISGGFTRWEQWWDQCAAHNVRFEDCTGAFLGTLPQQPEDDDEYSQFGEDDDEHDAEISH